MVAVLPTPYRVMKYNGVLPLAVRAVSAAAMSDSWFPRQVPTALLQAFCMASDAEDSAGRVICRDTTAVSPVPVAP